MRRYRRRTQDFFPRGGSWHVCCIQCEAGEVRSFIPSFALTPTGGSAYRRPPVWRAVVRPARYFFTGRNCLRQFRRARLGREPHAGKKRGFCRRNVGRSGARAFPSAPSLSVSLPCQRRQPSYHRHEGVEINRLGDVEIEAGLDSRGDVAFRCVAGHGDRQHVTSNLQPA